MKINNIICYTLLGLSSAGFIGVLLNAPNVAVANDVDKIQQAKQHILDMVIRPETVRFHDEFTKVNNNNTVTIKFTFQNGFGLIETRIMDIKTK
jgi:hypothetical protein